ncbi:MAG: inositol monophosphatase family protein [Sphaerochaetaceae bacterium]|jgi:fructose-1,6-bisphosphatase/inositol monophosphatase family enzyme
MSISLDKSKLDSLAEEVRACGAFARQVQHDIHRNYKSDGTVITETDLEVSRRILDMVGRLFPDANIISEEVLTPWKDDAPCTFVLDPIDGTDVYSQGLPSWAVALGIMDENRVPVGAMIDAPRWGIGCDELFVRLDPGSPDVTINGQPLVLRGDKDVPRQITMGAAGQRHMDFTNFHGKVRTFGSSIIHMLSPAIYPHFEACVNQPCYVWDVLSAHAVLLHEGMLMEYVDGEPFVYDDAFVLERQPFKRPVYAGTRAGVDFLRKNLPVRY